MTVPRSVVFPIHSPISREAGVLSKGAAEFASLFPTLNSGFSLRKLSKEATNVVRVRRSNDNAERDFNATEITDGTLTSWVGANDGFVSIWYNQALPTSLSGTYFNGTDTSIDIGNDASLRQLGDATIKLEFARTLNKLNQYLFANGGVGEDESTNATFAIRMNGSALHAIWEYGGGNNQEVVFTYNFLINTLYKGVEFRRDSVAKTVELWVGGVLQETVGYTNSPTGGTDFQGRIGQYSLNNPTTSFGGYIGKVELHDNKTGTSLVSAWDGNTPTDDGWADKEGSNNGQIAGVASRVSQADVTDFANDMSQDTAAQQPKIVDSGSLITQGGLPAIEWDGVDDYLKSLDYIVEMSANDAQIYNVRRAGSALGNEYAVTEGDVTSPYSSQFILGGASGTAGIWVNAINFGVGAGTNYVIDAVQKTGGAGTGTRTIQAYRNGATNGSSGSAAINVESSQQTTLGSFADGSDGWHDGKMQEVIAFKNTDNDAIEVMDEINKYYGVY